MLNRRFIFSKKKVIINLPFRDRDSSIAKKTTQKSALPNTPLPAPIVEDGSNRSVLTKKETSDLLTEPTIDKKITKKPLSFKSTTNLSFSDSISINPTVKTKKKEIEAETSISNKPTEAYTSEKFKTTIQDFKLELQQKGKDSLASIFEVTPDIKNNSIFLSIENKALQDEFNAQKSDFLDFIRKNLSNYNVQVTTEVNKDMKLKKAYTPQEKFNKMSEKNPILNQLVEKLEMDIGYA